MPLFEYRCADCGAEFEELAAEHEKPACPACHSAHTRRLLSACKHLGGGGDFGGDMPAPPSGGGCAGCSGGHCSTCH